MTCIAPPKNWTSTYLPMILTYYNYAEKDLKKLEIVVNEELLKLSEWLNSNKLSLNPTKSNFVVFHPYQRKQSGTVIKFDNRDQNKLLSNQTSS